MRTAGLLATVTLTLGLVPALDHGTAAATPGPGQTLQRAGRWLVDEYGRVVIVHGVNLVWKHAPYVPPDAPTGFTAADATWLAEHGFNGARLGTLWAGITPDAPDTVDAGYLDAWARITEQLAAQRIWMQFDLHQDQWNEVYGGEGAPDWAARRPAGYETAPVFAPRFPQGYFTPEQSAKFDDFWAGRDGLRDGWIRAIGALAARFRDHPYSMGYDLLNEPWSGSSWPECLVTGCPDHYRDRLQPAMELGLRAARAADPDGLVWFEPDQLTGGRATPTFYGPVAGENQLGYSWHSYCPQGFFRSQGLPLGSVEDCAAFSADMNSRAAAQSERMNAVGLMSEFGATDDLRLLDIDTAAADSAFTSWMYWSYKGWNDPTTADGSQGLFTEDGDLTSGKPKLRTLVRTYPQATAGIPRELSFDPVTGDFRYSYAPAELGVPTEIFVSPLHYPNGYDVTVTGGTVAPAPERNRVRVVATGVDPVTVTVRGRA